MANNEPFSFTEPLSGLEITLSKIRNAVCSISNSRAVGPDNIAVEDLKDLGIDLLHKLPNLIYNSGKISEAL